MVLSEEQLNNLNKEALIIIVASLQDQLSSMQSQLDTANRQLADTNRQIELLTEQIRIMNQRKFGRQSESNLIEGQLTLFDSFNEVELTASESAPEPEISQVVIASYRRLHIIPETFIADEHHVHVYASKDNDGTIVKAPRGTDLFRNSIATPSLVASIINGKYNNALPLERQTRAYKSNGINLATNTMANWVIKSADNYLSLLYDRLHEIIYDNHIIHADETPVKVMRIDNGFDDLPTVDRLKQRQLILAEKVDAYFAWEKLKYSQVTHNSTIGKALAYSIHQESYLRTFLNDGDVPMDNNYAEQAIRPFTIGRKNFVLIESSNGAHASAIIYSLVETAKANYLNVYQYFELLLTEIPKHMNDTDLKFIEELLSWAPHVQETCPSRFKKS